MDSHIKKRHKSSAESCEFCDVKFGSMKEMENHLAKVHNTEFNDEDSHMDHDSNWWQS